MVSERSGFSAVNSAFCARLALQKNYRSVLWSMVQSCAPDLWFSQIYLLGLVTKDIDVRFAVRILHVRAKARISECSTVRLQWRDQSFQRTYARYDENHSAQTTDLRQWLMLRKGERTYDGRPTLLDQIIQAARCYQIRRNAFCRTEWRCRRLKSGTNSFDWLMEPVDFPLFFVRKSSRRLWVEVGKSSILSLVR